MFNLKLIPLNFGNPALLEKIIPIISTACDLKITTIIMNDDITRFYNNERGQYNAAEILNSIFLEKDKKSIILTNVDLYIPIFTFIFGLASLEGQGAIVSIHRLMNEFYGLPSIENLLQERLVKEIIHEFGHLHGLRHCRVYKCVMASSASTDELDIKGHQFCTDCLGRISKKYL